MNGRLRWMAPTIAAFVTLVSLAGCTASKQPADPATPTSSMALGTPRESPSVLVFPRPLPSCEGLLALFPPGIYIEPQYGDSSGRASDEADLSTRQCTFTGTVSDNNGFKMTTLVWLSRATRDPYHGISVQEWLAVQPGQQIQCLGGKRPEPLPTLQFGLRCADESGRQAAVAGARSGTVASVFVGVGEPAGKSPDELRAITQRTALAVATAMLAGV